MNKMKLRLLVLLIAILLSSLIGCNSIKDNIIPLDTVQTKQTELTSNNPSKAPEPLVNGSSENGYKENLCNDNEEVLLSFKLFDSGKTLTLCLSKEQPDYIIYRFGTRDKIELEFPKEKNDSWSNFTYSYYLRGGGAKNEGMDLNYLSFENGGYEYTIYQEYTAVDDTTKVGVKIIDKATKKEIDYIGSNGSIEGSLVNLRGNSKIKTEI